MLFFASGSYTVAMSGSYLARPRMVIHSARRTVAAAAALVIGIACLRLAPAYVALLTFAIGFMILTLIISELECYITTGGNCLTFWGGTNGFSQFPDFGFRQWLKGGWLLGNGLLLSWWPLPVPWLVQLSSSMVGWGWRSGR